MPARKRHRRQPEHPDPVVRFGRALEQEKAKARADQIRIQAEREEEKRQARLAAEHAAKLERAERRLAKAIAAVKQARSSGRGGAEADEAYRAAKAEVVQLETGERPDWAPPPDTATDTTTDTTSAVEEPSEPNLCMFPLLQNLSLIEIIYS